MIYLTGEHALNMTCSLNTDGDWHTSALAWKNLTLRESEGSFFGDYGIESPKKLPVCGKVFPVANHIRALLDLIYERKYPIAQGMRDDFIVTDEYDDEIFDLVMKMKDLPYFDEIDRFMGNEYMMKWINYKKVSA